MKSLQKHLDILTNHKAKNPTSFWKVYDNENTFCLKGATLQAMVYLFEVNGANVANVKEKREKLKALNLDESRVNAMIFEISKRINISFK